MSFDPYAAPRADMVPPPPPIGGGGGGPWEIGDLLGASWRAFVAAWAPLVFAPILVGILLATPLGLTVAVFLAPHIGGNPREIAAAMEDPNLFATMLGWNVIQITAYSFFQVGLVRMRLAAARGQPVSFGALFSGGSRFGAMLGLQMILAVPGLFASALNVLARFAEVKSLVAITNLLSNLILFATLLLQGFGLVFSEILVVDREQGPIAAIKTSFALPAGDRGRVFGYILLSGLIGFAGIFCCGLPALVTVPYAAVCVTMLYTRLGQA